MILDYFFLDPDICPSCKENEKTGQVFCSECLMKIDRVDYYEYEDNISMNLSYPLFYNYFTRDLIAKYKFQGENHLYRSLGELMYLSGVKENIFEKVDMIVPVPLHIRNYKKRGFNQSELLAQRIAELSGLEMRTDLVKKIKKTRVQHDLSLRKRMTNLANSIAIEEEFYKYKILLIDDVYTTGATINSIVKAMDRSPVYIEAMVLASAQRIEF